MSIIKQPPRGMNARELIALLHTVEPDSPVLFWNYEFDLGFEADPEAVYVFEYKYHLGGHVYSEDPRYELDAVAEREPIRMIKAVRI